MAFMKEFVEASLQSVPANNGWSWRLRDAVRNTLEPTLIFQEAHDSWLQLMLG